MSLASELNNYYRNSQKKRKEEKDLASELNSIYRNMNGNGGLSAYSGKNPFENIDAEMSTASALIQGAYGGWQDADTMASSKKTVSNTYNRLVQFQQYVQDSGEKGVDLSETIDAYKGALDSWDLLSSQYGKYASADEYNKGYQEALAYQKELEKKGSADLDVETKSLEGLNELLYQAEALERAQKAEQNKAKNKAFREKDYRKNKKLKEESEKVDPASELQMLLQKNGFSSVADLRETIAQKKVFIREAKDFQRLNEMSSVIGGLDYTNRVAQGYTLPYEDYLSDLSAVSMMGPEGEKLSAAFALREHAEGKKGSRAVGKLEKYRYLEDDEFDLLAYYLAKDKEEGTDLADEYLKLMETTLLSRQAVSEFNADLKGNDFLEVLQSIPKGLDDFTQGVKGLFVADEIIAPTVNQLQSELIKEDLKDAPLGSFLYDVGSTTANMLPSIAAGAVANFVAPGAGTLVSSTLLGSSAAGNAYQEMLKQGYNQDQARAYATLSGISETLMSAALSKVFGGKVTKPLERAINSINGGIRRFAANFGLAAASEGFEEAAQEFLSPFFENLALGYEKNTLDDINWGNVAYSGLLGAVSGGLFETVSAKSGLTKEERAVVNKIYKDSIGKSEADGKKLTSKEKEQLYDKVMKDLSEGQISTDAIEEILGGESLKAYKDAVAVDDAAIKELERLYEGAELEARKKDIFDNSKAKELKTKLGENVFSLVKKSRLGESYREKARLGVAYDADLSQYSEKQQAFIKKAIDSKVLNNTRRTHRFVDMLAKFFEDRDIDFDFTNNEKLKSSSFAVDGAIVNGYKTADGKVVLNLDSPKYMNSVVGHEVTHVLEGTELYDELRSAVEEFAQEKGEYDARLRSAIDLYKNLDGYKGAEGTEAIKKEVVADLVGDYLFTDEKFVQRLYAGNRNLFQRLWDEVKYLYDTAVAAGHGERKLLEVKRAFEKAYQEGGKAEGKVRYSITEPFTDLNGKRFENAVLLDTDFFDGISPRNWGDKLQDEVNRRASTNPFILPIVDEKGNTTLLQFASPKENVRKNGGSLHKVLDELSETSDNISKLAVIHIDEIVSVSEENSPYFTEENKHGWMDKNGWLHRNANVINQKNGNIYNLTVDIAKTADGRSILYATKGKIKKVGTVKVNSLKIKGSRQNSDSNGIIPRSDPSVKGVVVDFDGSIVSEDRISPNEGNNTYSLSYNKEIAEGQSDYVLHKDAFISEEELAEAQKVTNAMVDVMMKYSSILPEDKIGKVLTKNGSYDRSVENTTICVRTLAYNEFVDKVQEQIGRPLTQMESFLVSQKLYDIATEPQCLYCYVSLDRKAFNDMLLRYMTDRDTVIAKYNNSDKSPDAIAKLYEEFLNGRKDTKNMKDRFNKWISYVDNGTQLLSLADIATEDRQTAINANGGILAEQLKDARAYAQSASWSKIQKNYVAYRDEILKLGDRVVKNLNEHYGMRWYSFSDYSAAFIVENMQQITDASIRGLKGLAYTKDTDFAEVFAPSGMNINVSVFVNQDENGNFYIDEKQSANFEKALELRERYPNVGIVATVTNDDALRWAGEQGWSDVIIPFHIVRTGMDVAEYYKWLNYTSESADTVGNKDLWESYLDSLNLKSENARKKVSKNIYPSEHKNNKETYLSLCESRGLTPRFVRFAGEPWYMKLVNETRLSADESTPLKPNYNLEAAKASFQRFVEKGGYEGGWYKDGVDVDSEAAIVASDVLAGKKANEVDYGRQDQFDPEAILGKRKNVRTHGNQTYSLTPEGEHPIRSDGFNVTGEDVRLQGLEYGAPIREDLATEEAEPVINATNSRVLRRLTANLDNQRSEIESLQQSSEEAARSFDEKIAKAQDELESKKDKDTKVANALRARIARLERRKADTAASYQGRIDRANARARSLQERIEAYHPGMDRKEMALERINRIYELDKKALNEEFADRYETETDFNARKAADYYNEIRTIKKGVRASAFLGELLDLGHDWKYISAALANVKRSPEATVNEASETEAAVRNLLREEYEASQHDIDEEYRSRLETLDAETEEKRRKTSTAIQRQYKSEEIAERFRTLAGETSHWKDKRMGVSFKTSTLRRNLRYVVRDENGKPDIEKADAIYEALQGSYNRNEAAMNREANRIKKVFADMKITDAESVYIQLLGELRHNPDTTLTEEQVQGYYESNKKKIDTEKVDKAIALARETYDGLLVRINEVLRDLGMKEIPYREGYFPHFTEEKQGWVSKLFNWKKRSDEIPTDIAGLTEAFNPVRSYQPFNKQRLTDKTDYNFLKGFDNYVFGALDWIYHIEDIQNRRIFEQNLRYERSDEAFRAEMDRILSDTTLNADEVDAQIEELSKKHGSALGNFVTDLRAGTNKLTNKKSSMDRGMEELVNRKVYSALTNLSNRVSANMVAGSISSALTNFIPITQSWLSVSPVRSLQALGDVIKSSVRDDGVIDKSTFLTNRLKPVENLYQTKWDKASKAAGFLMDSVDSITSQVVWRSKYIDNLNKGMSEADAINDADLFAESVMAGRSRGNMPTIFDSKNPIVKLFTAFQLEVANQYGYMFKDAPQQIKDEGIGKLVGGYAKMFIGAYLFNALYSSLVGRDAALDPIGIIEDLLKDLGVFGDEDEEEESTMDAVMNFAENVAQEVPFVGHFLGGGRVPINSAIPYDGNFMDLVEGTGKAIENWDFTEATKEWTKPLFYLVPPFGGGQLKKTWEGLDMYVDIIGEPHPIAGSYTTSGDLRFTADTHPLSVAQAALFGQYSGKTARQYFDENRTPLNEKQTQELVDTRLSIDEYWDYLDGLKDRTTLSQKAYYINGLDLKDWQKTLLMNNLLDGDKKVDMSRFDELGSWEALEFATENPEKYAFLEANGYTFGDYYLADEEGKRSFTWAYENPDKYQLSKAVTSDLLEYRGYTKAISEIKADKDKLGNALPNSRKKKVESYINGLDLSYEERIVLFKSIYPSETRYDRDIVEYINGIESFSYEQKTAALKALGFRIGSDGKIYRK